MNLYLLERISGDGYDEAYGFVVRAPTPKQARTLASANAGDEGAETWLRTSGSSCRCLARDVKGEPEVVLRDYLAG